MKSLNWSERMKENWQTEKAYTEYSRNPNICTVCGACVWPQPRKAGITQARVQLCCSLACASSLGAVKRGAMLGRPRNEKGYYRKTCPVCEQLMTWRAKRCRNCRFDEEKEIYLNESLDSIAARRNDGWKTLHSQIRKQARLAFQKAGKEKRCLVCGYTTFVDICHIRAVADFPKSSTLSEVNAPGNLIALCPTHHSEFDNDSQRREDIMKKAQEVNPAP